MSVSSSAAVTVKLYAQRLDVKDHTVLGWINSGQLQAIDVSANPGTGRPTWRVPIEAIVEFESRRSAKPAVKPTKRKKKKQDSDFVQYF